MLRFFKHILNHPCNKDAKWDAMIRYLRWQLGSRILGKQVIHQFTEKSKLIVETGMTGATLNVYCGLQDFEDMGFFLHVLRPGDLFIDCGANIGSYSVLAGAHCGSDVLSIEALPDTFQKLQNNFRINNSNGEIELKNVACGATAGSIHFTADKDTMNHVAQKADRNTIEVPMVRLDSLIPNDNRNKFLKIDVEGFETEVLKGSSRLLESETLKAIVIELNGSGEKYGHSDSEIDSKIKDFGFTPVCYNPVSRSVSSKCTFDHLNILYIRETSFISVRVSDAEAFRIYDRLF
jgi:FkbM family methyltransferase